MDARSGTLTKSSVVSARCRAYPDFMKRSAFSFAIRPVLALAVCLALIVTGIAPAVAMEHEMGLGGHAGDGSTVAWTANDHEASGHEAHHGRSGEPEAACCEPEPAAVAGCQVMACCLLMLQHPELPAVSACESTARAGSMVSAAGPSMAASLPERPPRLS